MIEVVEYNPAWPGQFATIRDRVWPHVRDIAVTLEHVGSTAVPGLAAKPIIEVDVVIPRHAKLMSTVLRLANLGYQHRGDLGVVDREAFATPEDLPAHHLYVCRQGSAPLRNHLAFRDHLRQHSHDAAAYAALKRSLSQECADVADYTRKKTDFIVEILSKCGFSDDELASIRQANVS